MAVKYYVRRKSDITGRVEYQRTKCLDNWCPGAYIKAHPERVWQFSYGGAKNIVERNNSYGWHYEFSMVPVEEVWKELGIAGKEC